MTKILTGRLESIDRAEMLRYLGYGKNAPSEAETELIDECEREALSVQALRCCYELFPVTVTEKTVDLGFCRVESADLSRRLAGCDRAAVFACTVGLGFDRLIAKYSRLSPARQAVFQALGAAAVESWCDEIDRGFAEYGKTKKRFSCGYGDLPLEMQGDIFTALSVTKNIGITLSEGFFMTPSKSVTAIVGIGE